MPSESALHVNLVSMMIAAVEADHKETYGLVLYADLPTFGRDRPPALGGYVPDVFAVDAPETVRIVGEAKTPGDLETDRSCRQIKAFLIHLSRVPNSKFYLSVPWIYRARASTLVGTWADAVGATHVRKVVTC